MVNFQSSESAVFDNFLPVSSLLLWRHEYIQWCFLSICTDITLPSFRTDTFHWYKILLTISFFPALKYYSTVLWFPLLLLVSCLIIINMRSYVFSSWLCFRFPLVLDILQLPTMLIPLCLSLRIALLFDSHDSWYSNQF